MHIHGHKFQILKESKTTIDASGHVTPTTDVICDENPCRNIFKWTNESWNDYRNIPGINIENGVYKDTVAVPAGGYVIARIWATNPGVWLLHCHRSLHLAIGMAVMLNESYANVQCPAISHSVAVFSIKNQNRCHCKPHQMFLGIQLPIYRPRL